MRRLFRRVPFDLAGFILFGALSCLLTYPLAFHVADHLRDDGDSYEYAWDIGFGAYQLTHDPLHLFDGNIFYPFPLSLAYSDSTVPNILLGTPIVAVSGNPVLALNVLILLTFSLGGFGMYLFVRQRTGSWSAGLVAGILYAFSPFRFDHLAQLPNVSTEWAPFALWSFDRYVATTRARWAAGFALFGVLQVLVSFYYAFILGIGIAIYVVVRLVQLRKAWIQPRWVIPFGASCVVGALATVPFVIPYFTVERWFGLHRTIDEAVFFSAWPANYLAANRTSVVVLITPILRLWQHIWPHAEIAAPERSLYPGLLIVILAIVAIARRPKSATFAPVGMVAAGLLLSFGPIFHIAANVSVPLPFPMPYTVLYHYLPGFTALRVPARFGALVVFGLAILAGDGLAYLQTRLNHSGPLIARLPLRAPSAPVLLAVVSGTVAVLEGMTVLPLAPAKVGADVPPVYRWLAANPEPGAVVELPIDDNAFHESPRSYYSTYTHRPLVNGFRSFIPPQYNDLADLINLFPASPAIQVLQRLAVRFVVVHRSQLPSDALQRLAVMKDPPNARLVAQFGTDAVYRVSGELPPEQLELSLQLPGCAPIEHSDQPIGGVVALKSSGRVLVLAPGTRRLTFHARWADGANTVLQEQITVPIRSPLAPSVVSYPIALQPPVRPGIYTVTLSLADPPGLRGSVSALQALGDGGQSALVGDRPRLLQAQVGSSRPIPGQGLDYTLIWQTPTALPHPLIVFVNAYDARDQYWSFPRGTEPRLPDRRGSSACGNLIVDNDSLPLRPDIPPGQYWIEAGLLDTTTGRRVPFVAPDGKVDTRFVVGSFWIRPPNVTPTAALVEKTEKDYSFAGLVTLEEGTISGILAPNGRLDVSIRWNAETRMPTNYTVFVHVLDRSGRLVAQYDGQPTGGIYPTSAWLPGESILDRYSVRLPASLPPGHYRVAVGLYDLATLQRLPVVSPPGEKPTDQVELGTIEIQRAG